MFVEDNNEPFSICDRFSKIVSNISPNSKLAKKNGAGKTKTTQITKCKGNQLSVLKKPNVHSVYLKRKYENGYSQFCFCFFVFILPSRKVIEVLFLW